MKNLLYVLALAPAAARPLFAALGRHTVARPSGA
jgi:hypothetical protein